MKLQRGSAALTLFFASTALGQTPPAPLNGPTVTVRAPAAAMAPADAYAALGSDLAMANHLNDMGWSEAQIASFIDGLRAAFHGKPVPFNDAARQVSTEIAKHIAEMDAKERKQQLSTPDGLKAYLKDICKQLKLQQSDSGLCYSIEFGPTGIRPSPDDTVIVSCRAFAADGKTAIPELSAEKAHVKVSDTLPGFVEGLQMMSAGSKALFVLPPALSFGSGNWPAGVDRGTPIIFRIILDDVVAGAAIR
jgi:FKBP-type peptidyl-prolyl cis-trans isomerase